ncbi:MAG TPA: hypothetical protein VK457_14350 [Chloroflexota bacterium]|jgi:hypothetical protein|nr:hypothetical protein [Chloroflexota bacterium]
MRTSNERHVVLVNECYRRKIGAKHVYDVCGEEGQQRVEVALVNPMPDKIRERDRFGLPGVLCTPAR